MARKNNYPELQGKFELGLSNSMEAGKTYNGKSLLELIIKDQLKLGIKDAEAEDLEKNFSNYIYRATKEEKACSWLMMYLKYSGAQTKTRTEVRL